jgi:hypothetical protein
MVMARALRAISVFNVSPAASVSDAASFALFLQFLRSHGGVELSPSLLFLFGI